MEVDDIEVKLNDAYRALALISNRAYRLSHTPWFFLRRKLIMALSDDVNAVTASLAQVESDFPPALQKALVSSFAAGEAAGNATNSDPALPGAVANLTTQTGLTIAALQGALTSGNSTGGSSSVGVGNTTGL